jgi:soluble lytic murein transglycosylase-like protein
MADDIEKFVLTYAVDSQRATKMLEDLNALIEKTNKGAKSSHASFRSFLSGVSPEFSKLNSFISTANKGLEGFGKTGLGVGVALGGLAATMTAIGIATRMAIVQMNELNRRRIASGTLGFSSLSQESFGRNMVQASGGGVTTPAALNMAQRLSDMINQAAQDPDPMSHTNTLLRMAGITPRGANGLAISGAQGLNQLSTKLSGLSPQQGTGIMQGLGISDNPQAAAQGLAALKGNVTTLSDTLADGAKDYQVASDSARDLQNKINTLGESFRTLSESIGGKGLVALDHFAKWIGSTPSGPKGAGQSPMDSFLNSAQGGLDALIYGKGATTKAEDDRENRALLNRQNEADRNTARVQAEKAQHADDAVAAQTQQTTDQFMLAVNLFSGASGAFSDAIIDQKQAWAAWAGEVGAAGGLKGPAVVGSSGSSVAQLNTPSAIAPFIAEAAKKYGVDPDLIRKMIYVESKFNQGAVSDKGATGLMQVMPSNFASLGITDPKDPRQNIMGGTQLYAQYLKMAGGDQNKALMMYNAGLDPKRWDPSYVGLVNNTPVAPSGSNSMTIGANPKDQYQATFDNNWTPGDKFGPGVNIRGGGDSAAVRRWTAFAGRLSSRLPGSTPLSIMQPGNISSGDMAFAIHNELVEDTKDMAKAILRLQNMPKGLPAQQADSLRRPLEQSVKVASSKLADLMDFASGAQSNAKAGGRELSRSQPISMSVTVPITIQGGDYKGPQLAALIRQEFEKNMVPHMNDIINLGADAISH